MNIILTLLYCGITLSQVYQSLPFNECFPKSFKEVLWDQ